LTDRLQSGHGRLDQILDGGLPGNAINLIIGVPGSGKTILTQQYVFNNATAERPALYLSTVSEPFDKIIRYGQSLEFFDISAIGQRVIYEDLGRTLQESGLAGVLTAIDAFLKDIRPGLVVIDSFKALHAFSSDEGEFRRFLHELAGRLTATAASTFWVGEYTREQAQMAAEFAVADAIISLGTKRSGERELRVLQVLKLRGSSFASGEHAYRISKWGLDVFPRLADPQHSTVYSLDGERQSTGIPALDQILRDGYWPGAATLVCGPSGIGKTLMALHFIFHGARLGQPGVIASFQENQTQLGRIVKSFGWDLDDAGVHLLSRSPVDMYLDEWVYELLDLIDRTGAKRVMIDSLADLMLGTADPQRFREWMYSLIQRCTRLGVSLMMTMEIPELFEVRRVSENGMSHLSDNVVLLQYVQEGPRLSRALTVLKTRASHHTPTVHRFEIGEGGLVLGAEMAIDRR
jgi:circadian clock protein KaiC